MKNIVIAVILLSGIVFGNALATQIALNDNVQHLRSENLEERKLASSAILEVRTQMIGDLEQIVMDFTDIDQTKELMTQERPEMMRQIKGLAIAKDAIILLGKLRSTESVQLLVDNLTFRTWFRVGGTHYRTQDYYPCVGALIEIGMPSLEPVLEKAQESDDEKVIFLSACVVKNILGETLAPVYMDEQIENAPDETKRARLVRVEEQMKDITIE